MRIYDFKTAQNINNWIANSENVKRRIVKFYRKNALVIYPPVEVNKIMQVSKKIKSPANNYFLMVSRLVGAKGLEETAKAFKKTNYKLKIVGESAGFSEVFDKLDVLSGGNIELLGRVDDEKLYELYAGAKGFIALAKDEDFGVTPVEAMAAGTPVIAFNGGGFKESVVDGKTGILINDTDERTVQGAVQKLIKTIWNKGVIQKQAEKFSKERFINKIKKYVSGVIKKK